jgi:hypothetical protein
MKEIRDEICDSSKYTKYNLILREKGLMFLKQYLLLIFFFFFFFFFYWLLRPTCGF